MNIEKEFLELKRSFDNISVVGPGWSGDSRRGFMFNPPATDDSGAGIGTSPPPPPPATGACCIGTDCSILTEADCIAAGGIFQGIGVPCDPNPCMPPCNGCGFDAFDGSGRKFLRLT